MVTKVDNSIENLKNLWIEIFLDSTNKVSNIADGSVLNATAFGTAKVAQKAIKDVAITEAKLFPDTATGGYLDKCAALYGVSPRKGAIGSSTYIRVYANPGTKYTTDAIFVNKNGIRFQVDQELIVGSSGYGYVGVRSVNSGYATNVAPNSIISVTPQPVGHIECTNEYYAIGGRDSEDDETFRIRIKNNLNVLSKGTLEYYTQIFQNLDDRVLKVLNVGLDENGYFVLYLVSQNGIYFLDSELAELLEKAKSFFGLFELNLQGNVSGIILKNAEWFFIGSDRGIDFRLDIDSEYDTATVRKNIQVALTKYLDFRFWTPGKVIQWDDLLDIVKKSEGVKYVPDQYFFPYYDEQPPSNQLPRIKGFVMRDATGNILYDNTVDLSPMFYPQEAEDIFRSISDSSLSLSQPVYFIVIDDSNVPVMGARISIGINSVITDNLGQATISLPNGTYNYTVTKQLYNTVTGSFVVLNNPISVKAQMELLPWKAVFKVTDINGNAITGAIIAAGDKTVVTDINGNAILNLKNGNYNYSITKLGYNDIIGKSFTINNADINITNIMTLYQWSIVFTVIDSSNSTPVPGVIVMAGGNSYLTDEQGKASLLLVNGNYNVTFNKVGYSSTSKNVTVLNQNQTISTLMSLFEYDVLVTVFKDDGTTPIQGALVSIKDTSKIASTNQNGICSFKLTNGSYEYIVTKKEYDDYDGSFNVNNNNYEFNISMVYRHFDVVISAIGENGEAVVGAVVDINNQSLITNSSGQVTVGLQNGRYQYTINKLGFLLYTGTVTVVDQNVAVVANMTLKSWNVTFIAREGSNSGPGIQGVSIKVFGSTYVTDSSGTAHFTLKNGSYPFTATKLGYEDYSNTYEVNNADNTWNIVMELKKFNAIFQVSDIRGEAVQGATVTVGSNTATTNEGGLATIRLSNGNYSYTVALVEYVTGSGNFAISNSDKSIPVTLTPNSYNITFSVKDDAATPNVLQGVQININNQVLTTNAQGQANISVYRGSYAVSYVLNGYMSVSTNINVTQIETFNQTLRKIWLLSFLVKSSTGTPLANATVKVYNRGIWPDETLTTKADGTTNSINTSNGPYSYSANLQGYSPEEGTGMVSNANKVQNVDLDLGYEITFSTKEGSTAVSGASILIDNVDAVVTGADGTVKKFLSNGTHNYVYTKSGYVTGSGTVVVSNATQTVNIPMVAGGKVTFTVLSQNTPVNGVSITVNDATRALPQTIITNNSGIATIELPNGNYNYTTSVNGFKDKDATAFSVGGAAVPVPVDLTGYKYYSVVINTKVLGTNLDGVSLKLLTSVGAILQTGTTVNGTYTFLQVVNGNYKVQASKDNYWSLPSEISFSVLNLNITREFSFYQISQVTFTVKNQSNNNPITGAKVILVDTYNSSLQYEGTTNASGIATLKSKNSAIQPSTGVVYSDYNYTVSTSGKEEQGTITVDTESLNKEILILEDAILTFNVTGSTEKKIIFNLSPKVGDFVYSDKTWSEYLIPEKTVVGVIVIVQGVFFDFVSLGTINNETYQFGGMGTLVNKTTTVTTIGDAQSDSMGKNNSFEIITQLGAAAQAAQACADYSQSGFPAGQWFLPSSGQLDQLIRNWDKITSAVKQTGKVNPFTAIGISSTQYDKDKIWCYQYLQTNPATINITTFQKNAYYSVYAFSRYIYNTAVPEGVSLCTYGLNYYDDLNSYFEYFRNDNNFKTVTYHGKSLSIQKDIDTSLIADIQYKSAEESGIGIGIYIIIWKIPLGDTITSIAILSDNGVFMASPGAMQISSVFQIVLDMDSYPIEPNETAFFRIVNKNWLPLGVAFNFPEACSVLLNSGSSSMCLWNNDNNLVPTIPVISDSMTSTSNSMDLYGKQHSQAFLEIFDNSDTVFGVDYDSNYTNSPIKFNEMYLKGYTGSLGEMAILFAFYSAVNEFLTVTGANTISEINAYWTSSQAGASTGYSIHLDGISAKPKSEPCNTIPLFEIPYKGDSGVYIYTGDNKMYKPYEEYCSLLVEKLDSTDILKSFFLRTPQYIKDTLNVTLAGDKFILSKKSGEILKPIDLIFLEDPNDVQATGAQQGIGVVYTFPTNKNSVITNCYYSITFNNLSTIPFGLAIITPFSQFIVDVTSASSSLSSNWGATGIVNSGGATVTSNSYKSLQDFNGKRNSKAILAVLGDNATVVKICSGGLANGNPSYLPSRGQLGLLAMYEGFIDLILTTWASVAAGRIFNVNYWSSTQYNDTIAYFQNGGDNYALFSYSRKLRSENAQILLAGDIVQQGIFPIEGAQITLEKDPDKQITTNSAGIASTSVAKGKNYSYDIIAAEYLPVSGTTGVLTGDLTISKELQKGVEIIFEIRSDGSARVQGATVTVINETDGVVFDQTKISDSTGLATFSLAKGRKYFVTISKTGFISLTREYTISENVGDTDYMTYYITGHYSITNSVVRASVPRPNMLCQVVSTYDNVVEEGSVIDDIDKQLGRVLFKRTGDKTGVFIRLNMNDSNFYWNGRAAKLDGTEGDVMVYLPNYWYNQSPTDSSSLYISNKQIVFSRTSKPDYIEVPASLIGACKASMIGNKMYSRFGVTPITNKSYNDFISYAQARGTGYQIIDYNQHCQIAQLFYSLQQTFNGNSVCGVGNTSVGVTGTTAAKGNGSTSGSTIGWLSWRGIEGIYGGYWEAIQGIVQSGGDTYVITNPDGTTRSIPILIDPGVSGYYQYAYFQRGDIVVPYFDMTPIQMGGSGNTYLCSFFVLAKANGFTFFRSCDDDKGNIGTIASNTPPTSIAVSYSSRLAFRGTLTEMTDVDAFKDITPV